MPITENNFSEAEFTAALTANKDALLPIVKTVLGTGFKYVVQDENEHNAFKQNYEADVVKRKTSEWATNLEKDVEETTGIKKADQNEKYYDYFKRAMGTVTGELATLKSKSNPSEADKARIKQLEDGIAAKQTELTTKLSEKDKEIFGLKAGSSIEASLAKLRGTYKKDLPASVIEVLETAAKNDLLRIAKLQEDGAVTFLNDKGEVLLDNTTYKPVTAEALVRERLKDIIDTGKKQPGAGSSADDATGGGGTKTVVTALPGEVKTKLQLTEFLLKGGWTSSDKEWNEMQKLGAALPLR